MHASIVRGNSGENSRKRGAEGVTPSFCFPEFSPLLSRGIDSCLISVVYAIVKYYDACRNVINRFTECQSSLCFLSETSNEKHKGNNNKDATDNNVE